MQPGASSILSDKPARKLKYILYGIGKARGSQVRLYTPNGAFRRYDRLPRRTTRQDPTAQQLSRSGAAARARKLVERDTLESEQAVGVMVVDIAVAGVPGQSSQSDISAHDTLLLAEASIRCLIWSVP